MRYHQRITSPIGDLILVEEDAALVGVYHGDHSPAPAPARLGAPLAPTAGEGDPPTGSTIRQAELQLDQYFTANREVFDVPLTIIGTEFQRKVWELVNNIPRGRTRSYRDIASDLGNPAMGRAIGAAIRANPLAIVLPGHRVVAGSGAATGYAAGIGVKQFLLDLEAGREACTGLCGTTEPSATAEPVLSPETAGLAEPVPTTQPTTGAPSSFGPSASAQ